ncbi:MAG: hypothetical protein COB26_09945 [Piscirickettsiaceae bacterium]|nr:MAG: hypothetical protein COB89_03355 [Piscirickettsiaceae bacterium]PCI67267.1 MAG: hypothetical protein COB26_09945 [Piscirickettsiaceae bacterium]
MWKLEVYKVFMGIFSKVPSDFANHTVCRFVSGITTAKARRVSPTLPSYKKIEQPHKDIHEHGLEALKQLKLGESAKALEYLNHMEQASMKVLSALSSLSDNA